MMALERSFCDPPFSRQLAIIDTRSGKPVANRALPYRPASSQAWSSDGKLLALSETGPTLHLLTVSDAGQITSDRALGSPAGCTYISALFSPSSGHIIVQLRCDTRLSIVEVDPASGSMVKTLVASGMLGPVDRTGTYLVYGAVGPSSPPWYVLTNGSSSALKTPSEVVPVAW
jgi:WD40 repeat protein